MRAFLAPFILFKALRGSSWQAIELTWIRRTRHQLRRIGFDQTEADSQIGGGTLYLNRHILYGHECTYVDILDLLETVQICPQKTHHSLENNNNSWSILLFNLSLTKLFLNISIVQFDSKLVIYFPPESRKVWWNPNLKHLNIQQSLISLNKWQKSLTKRYDSLTSMISMQSKGRFPVTGSGLQYDGDTGWKVNHFKRYFASSSYSWYFTHFTAAEKWIL